MRRTPLVTEVIEHLRTQITSGVWPVGSRIPAETELMSLLQVARGTLREAVRALAHAGLLEVCHGDGTYVRATSELAGALRRLVGDASPRHLREVRQALEVQAAQLAARNADETVLVALAEALQSRAAAWREGNLHAWIWADWQFHSGIARATDNPLLAQLYLSLADPLLESMVDAWSTPGFDGANRHGHDDLLDALRERDPHLATRQAGCA